MIEARNSLATFCVTTLEIITTATNKRKTFSVVVLPEEPRQVHACIVTDTSIVVNDILTKTQLKRGNGRKKKLQNDGTKPIGIIERWTTCKT